MRPLPPIWTIRRYQVPCVPSGPALEREQGPQRVAVGGASGGDDGRDAAGAGSGDDGRDAAGAGSGDDGGRAGKDNMMSIYS